MPKFIELTSPSVSNFRWLINVEHVIQVRRIAEDDSCQISLSTGQITPAETYTQVYAALLPEEPVS